MSRSWSVLPDGTYAPLSETADLLQEAQCALEDAHDSYQALVRARLASLASTLESRRLVAESQRGRRIRTTHLRLVRQSA